MFCDQVLLSQADVLTIEDCNKECEEEAECQYFTLYKNDLNKHCQIVILYNLQLSRISRWF